MPQESTKESVSVSLDEELLETIDDIPGVKRSTLINEGMWEWLEDNGYY